MISKDLGLEVWKSPKTKRLKGHIVKNVKASLPVTVFCSNLKGAETGALASTCTRYPVRPCGTRYLLQCFADCALNLKTV